MPNGSILAIAGAVTATASTTTTTTAAAAAAAPGGAEDVSVLGTATTFAIPAAHGDPGIVSSSASGAAAVATVRRRRQRPTDCSRVCSFVRECVF